MWKFLLIGCAATSALLAEGFPSPVDIANLREDVRGLAQRVGELSLRVEQLERENNELRQRLAASGSSYVTPAQLSQAVDDLNRTLRTAVATSKTETLQHVAVQIEKLARQTNAALDSVTRAQAARPVAPAAFSDDFPKEGVSYTVQKGDSLASIAKKSGARPQDIINANKLSDPSRIVVGQVLFIPNPPTSAAK